ncbi:MAG: hypothetical protein Q8876_00180 [Bacillota bacterium]|nr:hypothetical protein [Bacillota bacterium]
MKTAEILKSAENSQVTEKDLELINQYTRRVLSADEVYTFSVVLCDNDIDRDFERFSVEALFALQKLFLGKTGVFDHEAKAENQTARIYDCFVEAIENKKTQSGDDYFRLTAKAYLPRSKKNEDFILSIDSGMQKEVSVGCSVQKFTCSVCGADMKKGSCGHQKGKTYKDGICHTVLSEPIDAYEWSFVAVPAQRAAGVIKQFEFFKEDIKLTDIMKKLGGSSAVSFNSEEAKALAAEIAELQNLAKDGQAYKNELQNEVIRLSAIVQPEITKKTIESVTDKLNIDELKEFKKAYEAKSADFLPPRPQINAHKQEQKQLTKNNEFRI